VGVNYEVLNRLDSRLSVLLVRSVATPDERTIDIQRQLVGQTGDKVDPRKSEKIVGIT